MSAIHLPLHNRHLWMAVLVEALNTMLRVLKEAWDLWHYLLISLYEKRKKEMRSYEESYCMTTLVTAVCCICHWKEDTRRERLMRDIDKHTISILLGYCVFVPFLLSFSHVITCTERAVKACCVFMYLPYPVMDTSCSLLCLFISFLTPVIKTCIMCHLFWDQCQFKNETQ